MRALAMGDDRLLLATHHGLIYRAESGAVWFNPLTHKVERGGDHKVRCDRPMGRFRNAGLVSVGRLGPYQLTGRVHLFRIVAEAALIS